MSERILFLTGHLAERRLRQVLDAMAPPFDWEVRDIGVQVAGLMTADLVRRRLSDVGGASRVMLPGRCRGDLAPLPRLSACRSSGAPTSWWTCPTISAAPALP